MSILFPNTDITIYNKYYDFENDYDMYQKTVIRNVDWQGKRTVIVANSISTTGVVNDDELLIFIDILDNYIGYKQFSKLNSDDRKNYFTLAPGDKIVKGEIDFEFTINNRLKDLEESYDDVVTIIGVTKWNEHMEVECK